MSGSILGMQGFGSNGAGYGGGSPQIPPGLLQMLLQHAQGGGMSGMQGQPPGGAMPQAPQLGAPQQRPMMPNPQGQMPQQGPPQQMPGGMASLMQNGGLSGLLAMLKGQQQGVAPQPGAGGAGGMFGASGALPPWLQGMLGGGAPMPQGQPAMNGMMSGSV